MATTEQLLQDILNVLSKGGGLNGSSLGNGVALTPASGSLSQDDIDNFNNFIGNIGNTINILNNKLKTALNPTDVDNAFRDYEDKLNDKLSNITSLLTNASQETIDSLEAEIDAKLKAAKEAKEAFKDNKLDESVSKLGSSWATFSRNFGKGIQSFGEGVKGVGTWGSKGKVFSGTLQKMGGGIAKAGGAVAGFAGKMSPLIAGVQIADAAFKACAEKLMAYRSLHTEQYIKALGAETVKQTNSIKISVTAMSNAVQASTDAITANIETNVAATKAIAENQLAQMKMNHTWTNWIPIWGTINKMQEQRMELQNQAANAEIENSKKIVDMWTNSAKTIDDAMQKMDVAQRAYQRLVGIPSSQMGEFREGLYKAGEAVAEFGKTTEDIMKARTAFINESGRNIAWSQIDTSKALSTGSLVGDETMNSFAAGMVLFNTSVADSAEIMLNVYKDANKMGISSQKLTKSVLSNLKQANKYNFKDGVEGFIKAAKWAETARYDMNALGATLDKVQEGGLEGVLQQSAQLQVLGGNAALNADPMKMMYAAYNDPEEFARMQQDALKNFGHINSKTGETQFNMADQMQISAIAKAFGLSKDQAMEMARASNKRSVIESANSSLKGDELDAVANRAQFNKETRQWEVTMNDGTSKNVSQLTSADLEKIAPEDTRTSEEIAKDTLSATEKIAVEAARTNVLLAKMGGLEEYLRHVDETTKITREGNDAVRDKQLKNYEQSHKNGEESLANQFKIMEEAKDFATATKNIKTNTDLLAADKKTRKAETQRERRAIRDEKKSQLEAAETMAERRAIRKDKRLLKKEWRAKGKLGYSDDFIHSQDFSQSGVERIDDGLILHNSGKVVAFNDNDDIMAAKDGGFFSRVSKIVSGGEISAQLPYIRQTILNGQGEKSLNENMKTEISIKPVEIRLNGTLNLSGGGQSVNFIDQLKNNQEFLKQLSQMISSEMSKAVNGGKSVAWNGRFGK